MTYAVTLARSAEADLVRIAEFLAEHDEDAARRAGETIKSALRGLQDMPRRTPRTLARYRVTARDVLVARVFHMREDRGQA